jgi:hypothetical protein
MRSLVDRVLHAGLTSYKGETKLYRYHFEYGGCVDVQYGHKNAKGQVDSIRLEWNPNKVRARVLADVLACFGWLKMEHGTLTRIDWAVDYPCTLLPERFVLPGVSKGSVWTGAQGPETVYFGSSKSDKLIRVYDKRKERIENGNAEEMARIQEALQEIGESPEAVTDRAAIEGGIEAGPWWRVECQDQRGRTVAQGVEGLENPFLGMMYAQGVPSDGPWEIGGALALQIGLQNFRGRVVKIEGRKSWERRWLPYLREQRCFVGPCQVWERDGARVFGALLDELKRARVQGAVMRDASLYQVGKAV